MFEVGNTPLVELLKIREEKNLKAKIFAKLESFNPAGSTKDRVAKQIIDDAIKAGQINKHTTIVEATSGNTGIALAAYAKELGNKVVIFMPENMSQQRIDFMESYGAKIILTSADKNVGESIALAKQYAQDNKNCFYTDQFGSKSNVAAHYNGTAKEIYKQTNGEVDTFVDGIGTGGTIAGVGTYLKEQNANTKIVAVLPDSYPHVIQGIGDGFDPPLFLKYPVYDKVAKVSDEDTLKYYNWINNQEGYSAGISSGANLAAAIDFANENPATKNIVILCADGVDRYK